MKTNSTVVCPACNGRGCCDIMSRPEYGATCRICMGTGRVSEKNNNTGSE